MLHLTQEGQELRCKGKSLILAFNKFRSITRNSEPKVNRINDSKSGIRGIIREYKTSQSHSRRSSLNYNKIHSQNQKMLMNTPIKMSNQK